MSTATDPRETGTGFDVERVRGDFPILARTVLEKPLAYLDNAATSQKPASVIEAEAECYRRYYANVHRGVHALSEEATEAFEGAREKMRAFLNAASEREIVFTRGTTESINLVAQSYGRERLGPGDELLLTRMEHHSNIVPWQLVAEATGARIRVAPIDHRGELIFEELEKLLSERTKVVAVGHVSNALGTINPVREIVERAHAVGAAVVVDGAQATPHMRVDVKELGCDFYALSGHKMFGPSGIGALYGREALLAEMPPYQGGGEMIKSVTFEGTTFREPPQKFEAGTPNIAGAIGLGAAIDYLNALDLDGAQAHEDELLAYGHEVLGGIEGLTFHGTAGSKAGVLAFVLDAAHPHDVGTILDHEGVAVRAGHHCAQPLMERYGVPATVRASIAFYNTRAEIDRLARGLERVRSLLG